MTCAAVFQQASREKLMEFLPERGEEQWITTINKMGMLQKQGNLVDNWDGFCPALVLALSKKA